VLVVRPAAAAAAADAAAGVEAKGLVRKVEREACEVRSCLAVKLLLLLVVVVVGGV
jgi:hypothetical protein